MSFTPGLVIDSDLMNVLKHTIFSFAVLIGVHSQRISLLGFCKHSTLKADTEMPDLTGFGFHILPHDIHILSWNTYAIRDFIIIY